jgi:hypothetical protein
MWKDTILDMVASEGGDKRELLTLLDYIENGVRLEFRSVVPPGRYQNSQAVRQNLDLVRTRVREYRKIGAVVRLKLPKGVVPDRVQPLILVTKPGKKPRLCLDLSRNLNEHLYKYWLKYESVEEAAKASQQGCVYGKEDLRNCYLSFDVHPRYRHFFVFQLDGEYYQFVRLPFGVSSACRVVTSLLSVPSYALQGRGIPHHRYLDDFLLRLLRLALEAKGDLARRMEASMAEARGVFGSFGLVPHPDKEEGPSEVIEFLGVLIDAENETLGLTPARRVELESKLDRLRGWAGARLKVIQSLVGVLSFAAQVLPGARPFMRRLIDITAGRSEGDWIPLTEGVKLDALYWLRHLGTWDGRCKWRTGPVVVIGGDASLQGWSAGVVSVPEGHPGLQQFVGQVVLGVWGRQYLRFAASSAGINVLECFWVVFMLQWLGPQIEGCHVLVKIDNDTDKSIINRQSTRSRELLWHLRAIADLATRYNFSFAAEHIPGVENDLFDFASRPEYHHFAPKSTCTQALLDGHMPHFVFASSSDLEVRKEMTEDDSSNLCGFSCRSGFVPGRQRVTAAK